MSATVRVTIDGRALEVPAGTLVTDAARAAEIHVPIFCSHAKLPPLGACRICVVEVGMPKLGPDRKPVLESDGAPVIAWMPKVQTACTTTVSEGMHVRTTSEAAVKAREGVMEFLLVNHPLDCPVCDEGGECQLQDLAFAFGRDMSRMDEAKRTFESEDLGPIVKKEANRCIVCLRCVRYCDEIIGDTALAAHQRGVLTEISSFNRQPLECEQCGNCIEVCPVGALTALPYRFKARPWDLRQHVTICPWCSNGCSVRLGVRGDEILRARGTEFRGVNQEYLCVRGRFGYEFVGDPGRLTAPLVRLGSSARPASFDEAVTLAATRLLDIAATHGPGAIAFLGGEKMNVEEQYLFQKLARVVVGTPHVDARTRLTSAVPGAAILAAIGGGRPSLTLAELEHAQEVLILGDDLQGEAPFAQAQIVKGARHHGLHLTIAHPRRVKLARSRFGGDWLRYMPGAEVALLAALAGQDVSSEESGVSAEAIRGVLDRLRKAERKAILFGRAIVEHPQARELLARIERLGWETGAITQERSSMMYVGSQNNGQGAMDMGLAPDLLPGYVPATEAGMTAPEILAAAADGKIKALWITSDNWLRSAPDRALAERALARAELVIVSDLFLTETARDAHVVFPATSFAEKEGVAVNCERRLQKTARALAPRRGARADWEIFQAVAQAMGAPWRYRSAEDVFREIAAVAPPYRGLSWASLIPDGAFVSMEADPQSSAAPRSSAALPAHHASPVSDGLALLSGGVLFLQGSLSHRTRILPRLAKEARAWLHPVEAKRLGLGEDETIELATDAGSIELATDAGSIELPVGLDENVPEGAVFVPYAHAAVELNRLGAPGSRGLRVRAKKLAAMEA